MKILEFPELFKVRVIRKINRFVIETDSYRYRYVHNPNTGRLTGLLAENTEALVLPHKGEKTSARLIALRYSDNWVFVNPVYHNKIFENTVLNFLKTDFKILKFEPKIFKKLQFDFQFLKEGKIGFGELKGCTWKAGEWALFPDAPTSRGRKHVDHLLKLKKEGYETLLVFLVFVPGVRCLKIAESIDRKFFRVFIRYREGGGEIWALHYGFDGRVVRFTGQMGVCS